MGGRSGLLSWTKDSEGDALLGRGSCFLASAVDVGGFVVCCFC